METATMELWYINTDEVNLADLSVNSKYTGSNFLQTYRTVPVQYSVSEGYILLATDTAISIQHYSQIRFLLCQEIRFVQVPRDLFLKLLVIAWPDSKLVSELSEDYHIKNNGNKKSSGEPKSADNVSAELSESSVTKIVDDMFAKAIKAGASDIHLEPAEHDLKVRIRLDGVLHQILVIPKVQQNEIISRIKILASMDIAEKRRPQDGRILVEDKNKSIDVRVSTMLTANGEKIVLRLLDKSAQKLDLETLGMREANLKIFSDAIRKPHGMILVTGPTGSGKTTTLYAALTEIFSPGINISTVEDPIEYLIDGINQTQYNPIIDYTFATAVKTFLRQDPDVVMIGEIRDTETAKYAIQAAQTGHLVFSTLHTNDAPGTIVRLLEMGVEPYLVASTLQLVIAQRLVRVTCKYCGAYRPLNSHEQKYLEHYNVTVDAVFEGRGCRKCLNSGYKGRIGIYEIMQTTPEIQELITGKMATEKIREKAIEQGMSILLEGAIKLVKQGETTIEEVKLALG